jgi:hypothetical protein
VTLPKVPSWYHHIPGAVGYVPCEGEQHKVSWRRGKFVLENHDLSAEQALLAFGGTPCACMRALKLWRHQFGMPPEIFSRLHSYLGAEAALAPVELGLPRDLGMQVSWDRSWKRSSFLDRKHQKLLQDALKERAGGKFRQHLTIAKQEFGARVISLSKVDLVPSIEDVAVSGEMDKVAVKATVALHASWLVEVWPRNLALVDGAFVVEVTDDAYDAPLVRAVRWEDQPDGRRRPALAAARAVPGESGWLLDWTG